MIKLMNLTQLFSCFEMTFSGGSRAGNTVFCELFIRAVNNFTSQLLPVNKISKQMLTFELQHVFYRLVSSSEANTGWVQAHSAGVDQSSFM